MRFLFVDRIVQLEPAELVRGIKHITDDDAYLYNNDEGRVCFSSSLIGESLGQLAAWNVMVANDFRLRPVAGVVASARLHRPAYVGETLLLESFIDSVDDDAVQYHSVARVGGEVVFTVDGALGPMLSMERFISHDEVRRQFNEINRPGDWSVISEIVTEASVQSNRNMARSSVPLQFDRLLHSEPGVSLIAEKRITRSAPYFPDHFPYNPVLPMTILLECKLNLAGVFLEQASLASLYEIIELRKIKMNGFVYPGDVLHCHVNVLQQDEQQLVLRYRSEVDGKRVCVLDVMLMKKGCGDE